MGGGSPRRLRLAVLGPVQGWRDGTPLLLGPVRRQAVLAALVLRPGVLVSQEQLLDSVWGENPPKTGRSVLPSYVYALRKALGEPVPIHSGQGGYRFVADDGVRLDLTDLAEWVAGARAARAAGDPDSAMELFSKALDLFRGEPLTGLPGPFAEAERQRLSERLRTIRLERLECLVLLGRFTDALDDLAVLAASHPSHPYDESLAALRMRALYGDGRQAEALTVFEETRRFLRAELGVGPGTELRRVHEAVLRRDDAHLLGQAAAAPSRPRPQPRRMVNELPGDAGQLVGREVELAQLISPSATGAVSVVTVDGTAGVGKTALVVRAARALSDRYPDGCLFVDLRAHSTGRRQSPEQALQRLLRSLGAASGELPSDLEELTAIWRATTSPLRLLLVLDDALDADQIRPLLPAGAGSRVLVAGRRRLAGLDAERRVTLEPLASGDAVSLLTHIIGEERAAREPEAARRLAGLCDGLPLALRIAGSRLQNRHSWTVEYLVGRMTTGDDGQRLGELSVGDRSVETAFHMSYDQLAPEQQRGFRALGLAPTVEFDVLTSAVMLGRPSHDTERILESLVDASLLQEPRPGRYRLHDLVRVHARRLAEAAPAEAVAVRRAAFRLFLDAARITSDWGIHGFPTGPQPSDAPFPDWQEAEAWLDTVGGELVDVVGHAAAHGEADYACWLAEALVDYFVRQGRYHEAQTALEIALAHVDGATDRRMALALRNCLGYTCIYQRRYTQAHTCLTEALDLIGQRPDPYEESRTLGGLGALALSVGDGERAIHHATVAVALAKRVGNNWVASMTLVILGLAHYFARRNEEALACFADAHSHAERDGRPRMLGRPLSCAADVHLRLGHYREAKDLLRQAVGLVEQGGDIFLCARSLTRLGTAEQGAGNPAAAVALHHQALRQQQLLNPLTDPSHDWLEMDIRSRLGGVYLATGRLHAARAQFQAVLDVHEARVQRAAQAAR